MIQILKYILLAVAIFFAFMFLMIGLHILVMFIKGQRRQKRKSKSTYKKRHLLLRLFWDLPKARARDFFASNPDAMDIHGLYMFCGAQGSGKTIAAVQFMRDQLKKYPLIKIRSNIDISFQHGYIEHWSELVNVHNGEIGQIDFLDELQNWFSSNDSKNFPPQMLEEVTQERKKHKVIVGTSQVFTRLAKPLREQTTYLCLPITFMGCFTVVRVFKPIIDDSGNLKDKKFIRCYCFVHDNELRESYDTYQKVERLANVGFKPATERKALSE
ncbi:MAG: hypothetical protein IJ368_03140 [Oscillospiraceae bacterium]|nr:hypothetical protein [Oscillospiraceae bacterium]